MKALFASFPERVRQLKSSPAVQSAFWVLLGSGGYQVIRLVGNLVLTRLLFPELFGLMAIVTAVLVGLGQLSDVGLREGVVNSDRIEDPAFMRTAWTMQILRTLVVAILASILAIPVANYYGHEVLAPVLIMIALSFFITGFKSIALLAYDKRLDVKKQMLSDLGVQLAGLAVVLTWAYFSPTIWAMVAGQVFSSILEVILSYRLFKGHHSRLAWEKKAVSQLFGFGKWIFISSAISYITVQGDRLIMGAFMTMAELGIYTNAATWSAIVTLLSINLSTRVLHPYFKQAIDHHTDFSAIRKVRNLLNAGYVAVCVTLAIIGDWLIKFLYDDRYAEGGWMLQILALGQVGRSLTGTLMPFMLARGDSFRQMQFSAWSAAILIGAIIIGGTYGGTPGVIFAYAFSGAVAHPVMVAFATKHGYNCVLEDLGMIIGAIGICILGWWLTSAPVLEMATALLDPVTIKQAAE